MVVAISIECNASARLFFVAVEADSAARPKSLSRDGLPRMAEECLCGGHEHGQSGVEA
jgi:hypothetical protein